jgi:hypothetical protein
MREAGKDVGSHGPGLNPMVYAIGGSSGESYTCHTGTSSVASGSPVSSSSRLSRKDASPRRLLDLYYKYESQKNCPVTFDKSRVVSSTKRIHSSYLAITS